MQHSEKVNDGLAARRTAARKMICRVTNEDEEQEQELPPAVVGKLIRWLDMLGIDVA